MEHYVIINEWANEFENGTSILAVTHSFEEAKKVFNECVVEERRYAEEHEFEIFDDEDTVFDAGENGYYVSNHTKVFIELVR